MTEAVKFIHVFKIYIENLKNYTYEKNKNIFQ